MELSQLRAAVRDGLDDNETPPLYPDAELTRFLNTAVAEACLRARLLQDDTGEATRIAMTAGTARYEFAPEILAVRAVHVSSRAAPLERVTAAHLDDMQPGWSHMAQQNGVPRYAVLDVAAKTLTLFPPPSEDGTIFLRVWRQPDESEVMEFNDDEPAIFLADPEALKHWALYEAFNKKDSELFDADRAASHLAIFESRFGPRPTEHALTLWSTQPHARTRRMPVDF